MCIRDRFIGPELDASPVCQSYLGVQSVEIECQLLRLPGSIDYLHNNFPGIVIPNRAGKEAVLIVIAGNRLLIHR